VNRISWLSSVPVVLFCAAAVAGTTAAVPSATTASAASVPLVKGLTLISAASERQGDYESRLLIEGIDEEGTTHLAVSADLPDPAGGKPTPVSFNRDVLAEDLISARTYKYLFSSGEQEFSGTTAMGTSAAVVGDLRTKGKAAVTLDGRLGGLGGLVSGLLGLLPGNEEKGTAGAYLSATGSIQAVEARPVPYPMIVNDSLVSLSAWHVKGNFVQENVSVPVEWYILDDPKNALTLRCAFGRDKLEIVRIEFPAPNAAKTLESELSAERRAVIYGIYFDFNSATIKPASNALLDTIASVMNSHPEWVLNVEGHTDNIGGDARNQDLSARRAAAVRTALVARGISEKRLTTAGHGAASPRDTNATLAGRARNRRVELTRQ
jgi:outer membrane protein OmpA-like peptidoglycan-associated protein